MTDDDKQFLKEVQGRAHNLAALFGVVMKNSDSGSTAAAAANKGGMKALELVNMVAGRILAAEHVAELKADGAFDLAGLESAPACPVEE